MTEEERDVSLSGEKANELRQRLFQTIRFLRPNVLFYDGRIIDLYQLIRALYLVRMKGEETKG
jgi:hypothetical protein